MYGLITTAKLNDVDPQTWLANVLARVNDMPQTCLSETSALGMEGNPRADESCLTAALSGCLPSIHSRKRQ